jgi:hypothetical protein
MVQHQRNGYSVVIELLLHKQPPRVISSCKELLSLVELYNNLTVIASCTPYQTPDHSWATSANMRYITAALEVCAWHQPIEQSVSEFTEPVLK